MVVFIVCGMSDGLVAMLVRPIAEAACVNRVVIFRDTQGPSLPKTAYVCPPRCLGRLQVAAWVWKLVAIGARAVVERPSLIHGFLLVPHGVAAMLSALLSFSNCGVTLNAGPIEITAPFRNLRGIPESVSASLVRPVLTWACKRCSIVGVLNKASRAFLTSRGLNESRIHVFPQPVDLERFRPVNACKCYDVISVSRLSPEKHVETVIRVAALLLPRFPRLTVAVVGDGPCSQSLRSLAAELGVDDAVHFLGHRSDVAELLNTAKVFLMTSEREGGPMSLAEALACGIPPVASRCGIVPDLCVHGLNAIVVDEFDDAGAFASGVEVLLTDRVMYERISREARICAESLTMETTATEWQSALQRLSVVS